MTADATLRTVWHLGDDVDTDALAPGAYMQHGVDVIAQHCLEGLLPRFAAEVRRGDLIVAGRNFGIGSSREQAAAALVHLGVAAVIAPSYGGLFFRNAFNLGLVLLTCPEVHRLAQQPKLHLDLQAPSVGLPGGDTIACDPIPDFLLQMAQAGGLLANLKLRLATRTHPHTTPPSKLETP
jgi:3-isopropylmalate/(R)-2-methylmalate dehydratase small subunit